MTVCAEDLECRGSYRGTQTRTVGGAFFSSTPGGVIYSTAPLKFARFINGGDWRRAPGYFKHGLEALGGCDHPLRQDLEDYLIRVVDRGQPEVETS